ncbi:MAG: YidH family protein [Rhizomicrobium sp.]
MTIKPTIDEIVAKDVAKSSDLPALPEIDISDSDRASVEYSQHRTKLSTHRTALSEHRTHLSEHRTALSEKRSALSQHRTDLSEQRSEMSSRRTGMSFQRTRMSADRTLMSVIRTSLSLISFGFTIYQFFQHLQEKNLFTGNAHAARNFGATLVYLGVGMVAIGIAYHVQFMLGLRKERHEMLGEGLIHGQSRFPVSFTLVVAILLLLIGVAAIASLTFNIGPFD